MGWKEKIFQRHLLWKTRPKRLERYLCSGKTGQPPKKALAGQERSIRAAAVQLKLQLCRDPLQYAEEMRQLAERAAGLGAELAVFPEYNGLQLLGMLPGAERLLIETEQDGAASGQEERSSLGGYSVPEVLRFAAPLIEKASLKIFSLLASRYNLYIMAGSLICLQGEHLVNRAFLFNPAGELVGFQDKVHLFPTEKEWGITGGSRFDVFDTPLGKFAMPVCMDATYFETFRILSLLGARIVMVPIANAEPYNDYLALRGIWPRVQESQVFGIKSALVGKLQHFEFTGRAGLYCPLEISPNGDGILAETSQHSETEVVTADLHLDKLETHRRSHSLLGDMNLPLYRHYFPHIYRSAPPPSPRPQGSAKTRGVQEE